jgi:hypothetical protein
MTQVRNSSKGTQLSEIGGARPGKVEAIRQTDLGILVAGSDGLMRRSEYILYGGTGMFRRRLARTVG